MAVTATGTPGVRITDRGGDATEVWSDNSYRTPVQRRPRPADARAVTRSTFVEVWHLAGHHTDCRTDVHRWIGAVTARRASERLHAGGMSCPILGDDDARVLRELVALLGAGRATVRTGPSTVVSVADLDLDLDLDLDSIDNAPAGRHRTNTRQRA
jgi:hypothetical protein